jgi:crotonobetainyl-CoA:carnitine CoA-transferase CaiB-like acyl-CoA transferase
MEQPKHVLDGYRVLDFSQVLAGPTVTRLMAEMGAEIIKVELPPSGDFGRRLPYVREGRSAYFVQQNRGKKSLCIDPRNPEGLDALKELVTQVDVLVQNFAPGAIQRLGLGWDVVHALNPRVVMCSISAMGQTGPLANLAGYDYIAQAYAGITHMIGEADGSPYFPMVGLGDVSTGVHGLAAIACALLHRERTGRGQHLDIALLDSYFHCHDTTVESYSASGGAVQPKRSGRHHYSMCPIGLFKGRDQYMFILALDHQWPALCEAMGRAELARDPRFADNGARVEHQGAVVEAIESWLASLPHDDAARRNLEKARVPCAPVLSVAEAVAHPHLRERGTIRTIRDHHFGELDVPGMPLRFSEFPNDLELHSAELGEHNAEILGSVLGYSAEHIQAMEDNGVLLGRGGDPPKPD